MAAKQAAEKLISEHLVAVFSKSYCPYCSQAKSVIDKLGLDKSKVGILELDQMGSDGADIQDPLGFPLSDNATIQELTTLIDALALKIYPKGYWQLTWTLNAINLATFFSVAVALRKYRSRNNTVPFWLFKLEHRPYHVHQVNQVKRWLKVSFHRRFLTRTSPSTCIVEADGPQLGTSGGSRAQVRKEDQPRMGWFITASCVNCHLILTSIYVILLGLQVVESYLIRVPIAPAALFEPAMLENIMLLSIFSTAYFSALGYIALLLPFAPPWFWNGTVVLLYVQALALGLSAGTKVALASVKLDEYRTFVYEAVQVLSHYDTALDIRQATSPSILIGIAKDAYSESLNLKKWQVIYSELVALAGYIITVSYAGILACLIRIVAKELVQLRGRHTPHSEVNAKGASKPDGFSISPLAATLSIIPAPASQVLEAAFRPSLSVVDRSSLPPLTTARSPSTTSPQGALCLPSTEDSRNLTRCSTPEVVAFENIGLRASRSSALAAKRVLPPDMASVTVDAISRNIEARRRFPTHGSDSAEQDVSSRERCRWFPDSSDSCTTRGTSLNESESTSRLELGPKIRKDWRPAPWQTAAFHEDIATHEGYLAVCRFLFNCIIDHTAIMLQSFSFACHSVVLARTFDRDYPHNAQAANTTLEVATMASATLFTVLYVVNCLNLFAPFLLFPASQVKLASMLASLTVPDFRLDGDRDLEEPAIERLQTGRKKRQKSDANSSGRTSSESDSNASRLKHQDSTKSFMSLTYNSRAFIANGDTEVQAKQARNSSLRSTLGSIRDKRVVIRTTSDASLSDFAFVPPACSQNFPAPPPRASSSSLSPAPGKQMIERQLSSNARKHSEKITIDDEGADGFASRAAAAVKWLRRSPAADLEPGASIRSPNAPNGLKHKVHGERDLSQSSSGQKLPVEAEDAGLGKKATTRPFAWVFAPFASQRQPDTRGNCATSTDILGTHQRPQNEPLGLQSGSTYDLTFYTSTQTNMEGYKPKGAQLVLDSLITSHALPIGGFYCHSNSIADSASALRLQNREAYIESRSDVSASAKHSHAQGDDGDEERYHERVDVSVHAQQRIDKQRHKAKKSSHIAPDVVSVVEELGALDEGTKRRRQRLRQQVREQSGAGGSSGNMVNAAAALTSSRKDPVDKVGDEVDVKRDNRTSLQNSIGHTNRFATTSPFLSVEEGCTGGEHDSPPSTFGRSTQHTVPEFVARSATPTSWSSSDPHRLSIDDHHRTTISIPLHYMSHSASAIVFTSDDDSDAGDEEEEEEYVEDEETASNRAVGDDDDGISVVSDTFGR
ncbi:potential glutaredoxin [Pseudozyma hubeiensis SY62]|uniref:Potential glutaredoxin n=1 Tax=Pseudozyma hubeiensis (strain SY62) TaxID=1305764 RepID=R9PCY3_PSEHS|nr:potential glutaredoxin [Pseudozyma hubeiensis SY62]GAC95930.1 potential glutaredoxin [Pseudozyma hubeiensis SY62]